MRLNDLFETQQHVDLFRRLEAEAHTNGSPKIKGTPSYYPEFDRVVINLYNMRFAVSGKAAEFMKSPTAERIIDDAGWFISVMKDHSEQRGFNQDKTPRIVHYTEVRLENSKEGDGGYHSPDILYHVTPTENVESILQHGLIPMKASRPEKHKYPPRIFLATSLEAATAIEKMFRKHDEETNTKRSYTVLKINSKMVKPLYIDPEFRRGGYYTNNPIPISAITI